MPTYLLHGFRWPRRAIRIYIAEENLEDAASEWLVAPQTTLSLLKNFHERYPSSMEHLNHLRFVEQYDPEDTSAKGASQPYAYVADHCEEVKLGIDVDEARSRGVPSDQWAALTELRDRLAPEEGVAWYVVVCGDEDRLVPAATNAIIDDKMNDEGLIKRNESESNLAYGIERKQSPTEDKLWGLKKLLGTARLVRRRSRANLEDENGIYTDASHPPTIPSPTEPIPIPIAAAA